jgi:hypothetical protein
MHLALTTEVAIWTAVKFVVTKKGNFMSAKQDGKEWTIREQIIEDPMTGLTFQFEVTPDRKPRFRIFGESLPFGNREIIFDENGIEAGAGMHTSETCRPTWAVEVDD